MKKGESKEEGGSKGRGGRKIEVQLARFYLTAVEKNPRLRDKI